MASKKNLPVPDTTTVRKTVTLLDVARAAGVSKTTASQALSGSGRVAAKTREVVEQAAHTLGFRVDPLAQLLSQGRAQTTIAIYSLDIDLSVRTRQLQLIQATLNDLGYSVPIYAYGYRGRFSLEHQMALVNALLVQRPRAVVCNTSGVQPTALRELARFAEDGGALVCYGYTTHVDKEVLKDVPHDRVIYAEESAFYTAARHLLELGHRDIGFFNAGQRLPGGSLLEASRRALDEFGAPLRSDWLFGNDGTRRYEEDGMRLGEEVLNLRRRPTAMHIVNDYAAAGFISVLTRAGVRVPEDISVIGSDDDAIAPCAAVPLTTVSYAVEEMSRHITDLVVSRAENRYNGPPRHTTVEAELVLRSSTAPPATTKKRGSLHPKGR